MKQMFEYNPEASRVTTRRTQSGIDRIRLYTVVDGDNGFYSRQAVLRVTRSRKSSAFGNLFRVSMMGSNDFYIETHNIFAAVDEFIAREVRLILNPRGRAAERTTYTAW